MSNKPALLDIQLEHLHNVNNKLTSRIILAAFNYNKKTDKKSVGVDIENGFARFILAVESVDTEYCKICADDDLFIIQEIAQQVKILDDNPDIANIMGQSLSYNYEKKIGVPESVRPSYNSDNPGTRICQLLLNYGHFFYGIYRTKVLLGALRILLNKTKSPLGNNVIELGLALLTCLSGKCLVYPAITLIREPSASESWYNDLIILNQAENLKSLFLSILQFLHDQSKAPWELTNINDFHFWFRLYLMKDYSYIDKKYQNFIQANSFQSKHISQAYNIEKQNIYYLDKICEYKKNMLMANK